MATKFGRGRISAVCLAAAERGLAEEAVGGGDVCTGCTVAAARNPQGTPPVAVVEVAAFAAGTLPIVSGDDAG